MSKLQEYRGKYSLTIPPAVVKMYGFRKGDEFEFIEDRGQLTLKKVR